MNNPIKGKDIIGHKVITLQKGQMIDDVDEIVYDPRSERVVALVVDRGGWFSEAKVILFEDIKSIGPDAVTIESDAVVRRASEIPGSIERIVKGDNYLSANKIFTEDGSNLGQVSDIYFDPATGKVVELEVSQGAIKNVQSGKKRIMMGDIVNVGEDATIVRSYAQQAVENQSQNQGIKGGTAAISDFGQKAKQKIQDVKDDPKTHETIDRVKQKVTQAKDELVQKSTDARWKNALGKYLTVNIITRSDNLLASRGDIITNDLLARADQEGMLDKVMSNTSESPVSDQGLE